MPIRQHLRVTVAAAVELPEAAAGRPGQAMRIRPFAGGEESALLRREDGFGLDVSDVHGAMIPHQLAARRGRMSDRARPGE